MSQSQRYFISGMVMVLGAFLFIPATRSVAGDAFQALLIEFKALMMAGGIYF